MKKTATISAALLSMALLSGCGFSGIKKSVSNQSQTSKNSNVSSTKKGETDTSLTSNQLYNKYFKNYVYTNDKYPKTSYMAITYDENDKLMYNTKYKDVGENWDQSTKYLTNVTISMKDKKITIRGTSSEDQQVSTIVFNVEGSSLVDQNGDSYTWKNMSPNQFESGTSDGQTEQQDNDSKFSATKKEEIKQLRDLITSSHGDNSKVSDDQLSKLIGSGVIKRR